MSTAQFIFENAIPGYVDSQPCERIIRNESVFAKTTQYLINGVPILDHKKTLVGPDQDFRMLPEKSVLAKIHFGKMRDLIYNVRKVTWLNPQLEIVAMSEFKTGRVKGLAFVGPMLLEFSGDGQYESGGVICDFVWHNGQRKFAVQVAKYKPDEKVILLPHDFVARVTARFPELGGDVFRNIMVLLFDQMCVLLYLITDVSARYSVLNVDNVIKEQRFH
ncbi:hypothetical protein BJ742DRAFT_792408 [Cladochytrium replicatum]|nr:hypothetical protein BJ742DRAFT_792408 [Cladochytrium replicatum]